MPTLAGFVIWSTRGFAVIQLPFLNLWWPSGISGTPNFLLVEWQKLIAKKLKWLISHLVVVGLNSLSTLDSSTDAVDSDFDVKY